MNRGYSGQMLLRSVVCCAALVYATCGWGADKPRVKAAKPSTKTTAKTKVKASVKPAPKTSAKAARRAVKAVYKRPARQASKRRALSGKREILTCRDGTEDRHARIGVVLIGGQVDSFAYYSKWKPRTCSIYLQRNRDPYSQWLDNGSVTNVNLERGLFLIEHRKGEYRFVFRDIDRERYCGMDGTINGTLTIRKGSQRCQVAGIMEEGTPLGEAYAHLEQAQAAPAPAPAAASAPPPISSRAGWLAQRFRREPQSAFPSAAEGIGD